MVREKVLNRKQLQICWIIINCGTQLDCWISQFFSNLNGSMVSPPVLVSGGFGQHQDEDDGFSPREFSCFQILRVSCEAPQCWMCFACQNCSNF